MIIQLDNGFYKLSDDCTLTEFVLALNNNINYTLFFYWCDPLVVDSAPSNEMGVPLTLDFRLFHLNNEIHIKESTAISTEFLPLDNYLYRDSSILKTPTIIDYSLALENWELNGLTGVEVLTVLKYNTQSIYSNTAIVKLQKWAVDLSQRTALLSSTLGSKLDEIIDIKDTLVALYNECSNNTLDFHLHIHRGQEITSGIISPERIGTGNSTANTYLNGNGQWVTVS